MTFQNLRYIVEVANCKSFSKAAKNLYITQSAVSLAVKETEGELGIKIFIRGNRGVSLTYEGEDFLKYCKEIVAKTEYLSSRYQQKHEIKSYFSLSTQHLPFAVRAFRSLLKNYDADSYELSLREETTQNVFHDVTSGKSELGVASFHDTHVQTIRRILSLNDLRFHEITRMNCYVFVRQEHPLANKATISVEDLKEYPFVTYDQQSDPDQYTEEPLFYDLMEKNVHVTERSSKLALLRDSDAFSIGIDLPNSNTDSFFAKRKDAIIAIPIKEHIEPLHVGYLYKNGHELSVMALKYLKYLNKEIMAFKPRQ